MDFASILFLHSLAHVLKDALVAKFGCKTEDISYYIEHPKLRVLGESPEKIRVIFFETAIGGFGYLKSFVERIQGTNMLEELVSAALRGLSENCEDRVQKKLTNLNKLDFFQRDCKRLVDLILKAYYNSFPNTMIYPHVNSIRKAIVKTLSGLSEEERSLLDDLLAKGPHCWDGCQLCVMMERGCTFLPFDQPFLVSERVLKAVLEKMLIMIKQPVCSFPLRKGVKKEFEEALSAAKSNIDLVSPWISPEIVENLVKLAEERDLKIRILTKIDPDNEVQVQSINRLTEASKKYSPLFQGRIMEELHAKGMLVDGVILLHGSFNFTISGLDSNVENLIIDCSLHGTKRFKEEFDELWRHAKPLI
ncbi:MAG: phospholipase D-like domain-containing protein [Candidatus Jordarchaeales archaeon]